MIRPSASSIEQRFQRAESVGRPGRVISAELPRQQVMATITAHGWTANTVVRWNGTTWVTASDASTSATDTVGVVDIVFNANTVRIVQTGKMRLRAPWSATATVHADYYLSTATPGLLTTTIGNRKILRHYTLGDCQMGVPSAAVNATSFLAQITTTGQQLYTGALGTIRGISYSATTLTSLPAASPTNGASYTAGLGGGYLYDAAGALGAEVWIANQPVTGGFTPGMSIPLPQGTTIVSVSRVLLSYGGGSAYVYLPKTA